MSDVRNVDIGNGHFHIEQLVVVVPDETTDGVNRIGRRSIPKRIEQLLSATGQAGP